MISENPEAETVASTTSTIPPIITVNSSDADDTPVANGVEPVANGAVEPAVAATDSGEDDAEPESEPDDESAKPLDAAGKPLHGNLRKRAIHRHSEFVYYADQMRPRGHNLRFWDMPRNRAKVIEFAQTALDGGIRVPLSVYFDENEREILIEHGETRWLAVKLLEGEDVRGVLNGVTDPKILALLGAVPKNTINLPAVQAPRRNEMDLLRDTVVHNSGNQFHPLELAEAIKRYTDWGKSQQEIAEIFGGEAAKWTQTRVSQLHQINFASPKLRQLLCEERIDPTVVVNAMRDYKGEAEKYVMAVIEDAKTAATAAAEIAEAAAVEAKAEVTRIIAEKDDGMVVPAPGKRPIPKLEAAQQRANQAAEKAEAAKRIAEEGPAKISGKDIAMAVLRRKPNAKVKPTLSKAAIAAFIDAVTFEAQYSPAPGTRDRMNEVLKRYGFPEMPARVNDQGEPLLPEAQVSA